MIALLTDCFFNGTFHAYAPLCEYMLENGSTLQVLQETVREAQYRPAVSHTCYDARSTDCKGSMLQCNTNFAQICHSITQDQLKKYELINKQKLFRISIVLFIDGQEQRHIRATVNDGEWVTVDGVTLKVQSTLGDSVPPMVFEYKSEYRKSWAQEKALDLPSFQQAVCEGEYQRFSSCVFSSEFVNGVQSSGDGIVISRGNAGTLTFTI